MSVQKHKKPWIPAGKNISKSTILKNDACIRTETTYFNTRIDQSHILLCALNLKESKSYVCSKYTILPDSPHRSLDAGEPNVDLFSLSSESSECLSSKVKVFVNSIKTDSNILKLYLQSLKRTIQFLSRYFHSSSKNHAISQTFSNLKEEIKNISFEELEYYVTLSENNVGENYSEELFTTVKCKERLLSKLLECHGKTEVIFQALLDHHLSLQQIKENEDSNFKDQIQDYEKKYTSQSSMIKDLERRISILQSKISAMESYKTTLEQSRVDLQNQLSQKENRIKQLSSELLKSEAHPNISDSEHLLEIIETLGNKFKLEKSTLKKALKYQKLRVQEAVSATQQLKENLVIKEKNIFELLSERDQLRVHLTVARNNILETKAACENFKSQIAELQDELEKHNLSHKKEEQTMADSLVEKSSKLNLAEEENVTLKENIKCLKEELNTMTNEIEVYKRENSLETSFHLSNKEEESSNVQQAILTEIRDQFLDLKKSLSKDVLVHENNAKRKDLEKQLMKLQLLYNDCVKENEIIKNELSESSKLKSSEFTLLGYTPNNVENEYFIQNLQMELKLKNEENRRLKQRERDLERQLEEVKEKLQRKEIETVKLFSLEEELNTKKRELSLLEKRREEESDRFQRTIKDLQESLDQTASERDSLEKHLQVLKSSLSNVFDST